MHADMTAVTIQPNKIVLNEIKDNQALLEPSYRKNIRDFLANPIFSSQEKRLSGKQEEMILLGFCRSFMQGW